MAYQELIKSFESIRAYMREFYVYGFKSRREYTAKSERSYDDERRRLESWLGDYMRFTQTAEGKRVFLSVDSRVTRQNPFYKAWKAKSFTDGDITLHFAIFDVLYAPEIRLSLDELICAIDERLSSRMVFDSSTLRKKLKEYAAEGIIRTEKAGRKILYSRSPDTDIAPLADVLDFSGEVAPCGVIGSFLQERMSEHEGLFTFKHHYITQAMDSEVMAALFDAIRRHRYITVDDLGKRADRAQTLRLVLLRIYISAQNGRQHLLALHEASGRFNAYRLDYLSNVRVEDTVCERFDALRKALNADQQHMWGVSCRRDDRPMQHVEFEIRLGDAEQHILRRLEREKRCGRVEKIDDHHYRYVAEVFDTTEILPWIRTFTCRITRLAFSDRAAERRLREDMEELYRMYGIDGGNDDGIQ